MNYMSKYQKFLIFGFVMFAASFSITLVYASDNNEELFNKAMDLIKSKQITEAIPLLEQIIKNESDNVLALKNLAVAYTDSDMCHKAIDLYDRILELEPDSSEILYGKAICLNSIGQPEQALFTLDKIDKKYSEDNFVLAERSSSYLILQDHGKVEEYLKKVLDKDPRNEHALINMIGLGIQLKDHNIAEKHLVKLVGNNPTPEELEPDFGTMPFAMQINDSKIYSVTVQMQVRNSSEDLVAIIESEKILHIPHPLIYEIIDKPKPVEILENDSGTFEIRKIVVRNDVPKTSYFLDRTTLAHEGYFVFFAYNMAIPIEDGDYTITEWSIKKKIR